MQPPPATNPGRQAVCIGTWRTGSPGAPGGLTAEGGTHHRFLHLRPVTYNFLAGLVSPRPGRSRLLQPAP